MFGVYFLTKATPEPSEKTYNKKVSEENTIPMTKKTISVSIIITTQNDIYIMQEQIAEGSNVQELMIQASNKNKFSFIYSEKPKIIVNEIYGVRPSDQSVNWVYRINDTIVNSDISEYKLKDTDRVNWNLETVQ